MGGECCTNRERQVEGAEGRYSEEARDIARTIVAMRASNRRQCPNRNLQTAIMEPMPAKVVVGAAQRGVQPVRRFGRMNSPSGSRLLGGGGGGAGRW